MKIPTEYGGLGLSNAGYARVFGAVAKEELVIGDLPETGELAIRLGLLT